MTPVALRPPSRRQPDRTPAASPSCVAPSVSPATREERCATPEEERPRAEEEQPWADEAAECGARSVVIACALRVRAGVVGGGG